MVGRGDFRPCSTPWAEDKAVGCREGGTVPVGPLNTWSNLAYGVAGAFIALGSSGEPSALVVCASLVLLMVGSAAYHAVPGRLTNAIDHAGIYATFVSLAFVAVGAPWPLVLVAALAGAAGWTFFWRADLNALIGLLLTLSAAAAWSGGQTALLVASLGAFVLGFTFWLIDRRRTWDQLWGHAAWHVLTAAAILLMYFGIQ